MRTMMAALFAVSVCSAAAHAQQKQIVPPTSRPRSGRAAAPTPPPATTRPTVTQPTYTIPTYSTSGPSYLAQADGSVIVNYGNGYERVLHRCASPKQAAPVDPNARDVLGRIPPPPGIAALQAGATGQPSGQVPAKNAKACYRHNGGANVEVVTGGQ